MNTTDKAAEALRLADWLGEGWGPAHERAANLLREYATQLQAQARVEPLKDERIQRLEADNAKARETIDKTLRDAERYRWLRDGGIWRLPYDDHGAGPEFDLSEAAIDAAMTKKLEQT